MKIDASMLIKLSNREFFDLQGVIYDHGTEDGFPEEEFFLKKEREDFGIKLLHYEPDGVVYEVLNHKKFVFACIKNNICANLIKY